MTKKITKKQLAEAVELAKNKIVVEDLQAREAIQLIYDDHTKGQRKKLLKNEQIKAIFDRFGVVYEDEG